MNAFLVGFRIGAGLAALIAFVRIEFEVARLTRSLP